MREVKKLPRQQLEKFSTIFTQLGLVLVLFIVFITLEHQTEQETDMAEVLKPDDEVMTIDFDVTTVFVKEQVKPQQQRPQATTQVLDVIIPVEESPEVVESVIEPEVDNTIEVNENQIIEVEEPDVIDNEDDPEPVILKLVTKVPVYKGCENLSETESRKCLDKKMKKLVNRYFDTSLATDLGLKSGRHSIYTQFVIDKNGRVSDVRIRAQNATLEKEAKRVVGKIPDFIPGEFNGKKVGVKYSLPITFQVE